MSDSRNRISLRPNWTHLLALIIGVVITVFYTQYLQIGAKGPAPASLCCMINPDTVGQLGQNLSFVPAGVAKVAEEAYALDSTGFDYINVPSELICGLYFQYCADGEEKHSRYKVSYGKDDAGNTYQFVYPLPESSEPMTTTDVLSIKVPEGGSIGPCPPNCYGESGTIGGGGSSGGDGE